MFIKKEILMLRRIILALVLFSVLGCTTSSADLNRIAQDSIRENQEWKQHTADLDSKYLGADEVVIINAFGKPENKSNEPYPYKLDPNCYGKDCEKGYSDEIWFYEFKRKTSSGTEFYSVYVYFKDGKVVRVR